MTARYLMRHMRLEDIPQVVLIDRASFPNPWSPRTYQFEIQNRETSHFVVLEELESGENGGPLRRLLQRLSGSKREYKLAGYGGCWLISGEAHISTIAVHPDYRGRGLGELLLVGMLQRGINLKAEYSVLEVRESNLTAQALYRKYEYEHAGRRKGYYRSNGEDALLMEARPLDAAYQQRMTARIAELRQQVTFVDEFTPV